MSPPENTSTDALAVAMRALTEHGVIPIPVAVAHLTDIGMMLRQVQSSERKRITGLLRNRADSLRADVATTTEALLLDALIQAWDPWGSGLQP